MKFLEGCRGRGPRINRSDFGDDLDHNPVPEFLYPQHAPRIQSLKNKKKSLFITAILIDSQEYNMKILGGDLNSPNTHS